MAKMQQTTPYRERPAREREEEARCFREVLLGASTPKTLYEAFGGIGMVTKMILGQWPETDLFAAELDADCVEQWKKEVGGKAEIYHGDTKDLLSRLAEGAVQHSRPLAAVLDFNKCTLLDLSRANSFQSQMLNGVFGLKPVWVELTDSSIGKLHLNWRSYGLKGYSDRKTAWEQYNGKLDTWARSHGYRVVASACHSAASYHRLEGV